MEVLLVLEAGDLNSIVPEITFPFIEEEEVVRFGAPGFGAPVFLHAPAGAPACIHFSVRLQ
jgi:hypothetical protein